MSNSDRSRKSSSRTGDASLPVQVSSSIFTTVVGLAIGGPAGAVIGAVAGPFVNKAASLIEDSIRRKSSRAEKALQVSFAKAGLALDDFEAVFADDPRKTDDFLSLLTQLYESDDELTPVITELMSELIASGSSRRDRLILIADSLRGLRACHLRILKALSQGKDFALSASDLAQSVDIPEIELRSAVHLLESRGMIKDQGVRPVVWRLRELGTGILKYTVELRSESVVEK